MTSGRPVTSVMLATNEPGVTCWKNTPKQNPPTRPVSVTTDEINSETSVTASNLGASRARTGSMPIPRNASSSSRIVRAPRSAQIAAAPDPETTKTVTKGPISFTVVTEAPVPDRSAAPNSTSNTLKRNTDNTVNGMAKNTPAPRVGANTALRPDTAISSPLEPLCHVTAGGARASRALATYGASTHRGGYRSVRNT